MQGPELERQDPEPSVIRPEISVPDQQTEPFGDGVERDQLHPFRHLTREDRLAARRALRASKEQQLLRSCLGRYGDSCAVESLVSSSDPIQLVLEIQSGLLGELHECFSASARSVREYERTGLYVARSFAFRDTQQGIDKAAHLLRLLTPPSGPERGLQRFLRYLRVKGL